MPVLKTHSLAIVSLTLFLIQLFVPTGASAQAWLPRKGYGNVSVAYKNVYVRDHLDLGVRSDKGQIRTHIVALDFEYGLTRRLAVNVGVPFAMAKYTGIQPHRHGDQLEYDDDGTYNGGFQDFRFGLRHALLPRSPVVITPFIDGIVPSHNYETFAHSAIGRNLRELLIGTNVGWHGGEDSFLSNVYTQARISYGFVERVLDRSHNRTNIDAELGYFLTSRLALSGLASFQKHHGAALDPPPRGGEPWSHEEEHAHMELLRSDMFDVGVGAAFQLNGKTSVYANMLHTVWGRNGHPTQAGLIVGINRRFRVHGKDVFADDTLRPETLPVNRDAR